MSAIPIAQRDPSRGLTGFRVFLRVYGVLTLAIFVLLFVGFIAQSPLLAEHGLTDWYYEDGWIKRKFVTDGWPTTLMLVNMVGYLCEAAWHHADLNITWGKAWIKLKTHSAR